MVIGNIAICINGNRNIHGRINNNIKGIIISGNRHIHGHINGNTKGNIEGNINGIFMGI